MIPVRPGSFADNAHRLPAPHFVRAAFWGCAWIVFGSGLAGRAEEPFPSAPVADEPANIEQAAPAADPQQPSTTLSQLEGAADSATSEDSAATALPEAEPDQGLPWLSSLEAAIKQAGESRQPILLRVGAKWCGWCEKLAQEISAPEAQAALQSTVRVYLDVDESDEVVSLGISAVPALRLLSPSGRLIDSRDGFLSADELVEWLQGHMPKDIPVVEAPVDDDRPPTSREIKALVRDLSQRDPLIREAAIRRLIALRSLVADTVVAQLTAAKLATRLSALEILNEWHAPTDGLDPWNPATVTAAREDALSAWLDSTVDPEEQADAELSSGALAILTGELDRYATSSDAEAEAMRERLARSGRKLLPEVERRLQAAETDERRQRLAWLRLRLLASDRLALGWPAGLARLASVDSAARHQAAGELVRYVTSADEPLLLALFADPDPLIRELSLRALHHLEGDTAHTALVQLLEDPEPNIRAAVLRGLTDTSTPKLIDAVVAYLPNERDPDLLVHAARLLRGKHHASAVEGLVRLLDHDDWRVRAEAADALGESLPNVSIAEERSADAYAALVRRLDDPDGFVLSKALSALQSSQVLDVAIEPLANALEKHPELGPQIIEALTRNEFHDRVLPHLRKFANHERPEVRAAAIRALVAIAPDDIEVELQAAVNDHDPQVRIAAARGLWGELTGRLPEGPREEYDQRLAEWHAGTGRPDWAAAALPRFEEMAAAESSEERLFGAMLLLCLGKIERAIDVLKALMREDKSHLAEASAALPWLPSAERVELFELVMDQNPDGVQSTQIAQSVAHLHNAQSRQ